MIRHFKALFLTSAALLTTHSAYADEGGVSFWLPGLYASFAAVPAQPGWSFATVYLHPSVSAGASEAFPRGGDGRVDLGVRGRGDLVAFGPTYTFAQPLWGAQFAVSLLAVAGRNNACVDATLTGPLGRHISGERCESKTAFGDLLPQATLKWNDGVDNYLAYITGDIPVGSYDPDRLANLGIGHGAIDGGLGYTYFNPSTMREFSIVGGLTYNFKNPDTDYQNGVDAHIDWGASQFLNKHVYVGVAGMPISRLRAIAGMVRRSVTSNRVFSVSARKLATTSMLVKRHPLSSISKLTLNSARKIGLRGGISGLRSPFPLVPQRRPSDRSEVKRTGLILPFRGRFC